MHSIYLGSNPFNLSCLQTSLSAIYAIYAIYVIHLIYVDLVNSSCLLQKDLHAKPGIIKNTFLNKKILNLKNNNFA